MCVMERGSGEVVCAKWPVAAERQHHLRDWQEQAGFNCIRLLWSLEMVLRSTVVQQSLRQQAVSANPSFAGMAPLQVMDAVIAAIADEVSQAKTMHKLSEKF